jgi:hypothetical protein
MTALLRPKISKPGTHALVIGVSRYRHVGDGVEPSAFGRQLRLEQLTCAARSASNFAAWLMNDYNREGLPLSSLQVLFSPALDEKLHPDIQDRLNKQVSSPKSYAATRKKVERALKSFENSCLRHKGNVAIVYVAGHGVQFTKSGAVLLLEDIGKPPARPELEGAIDVASVCRGLNYPQAPHQQFWFFDGCRQKPDVAEQFETMEGALVRSEPVGKVDDVSALFLASSTREESLARPGETSLFCEALLWALGGGALKGPSSKSKHWHVAVDSLNEVLCDRVRTEAEKHEELQNVDSAKGGAAVFHELKAPPDVPLHVDLIPEAAAPECSAALKLGGRNKVLDTDGEWPIDATVAAGIYTLEVSTSAQYLSWNKPLTVEPPEYDEPLDVTP